MPGSAALVWVCSSEDGDDGRLVSAQAYGVPLDDRALRYGDGIFETIRVFRGGLPFLAYHLTRLRSSLSLLQFPSFGLEDAQIAGRCLDLAQRNGIADGFVRLAVSRTGRARGFVPPEPSGWRLLAETGPLDAEPQASRAMSCGFAPWRVDSSYPGARVKSSSALDKILAAQHAQRLGVDELLFLNYRDELVEGSRSNVFLVLGGEIHTPSLDAGPLPGIARHIVIAQALRHGLVVREEPIPRPLLQNAQEMFLTNALRGVVPVRRLDQHAFAAPGPVTRQVSMLYREAMAATRQG